MGFAGFVIWCALLAAAGLFFPRRPYVSGFLFIALGGWSVCLQLASLGIASPNSLFIALGVASIWFAVGIRQLVRSTA
jgi:hypothetical protein